ncbi:hypothetical protein IQ266_17900 [filamentous cyanobacterium LEGE 11480]|uniref:Uncharacterized protein n=1 Tax=Romeriopsis navalis LEGE 11480 TaxID=2777977 RepID=A0A928Z5T8_9CYAN|nr:hypothetical protein [Romeriopsis navalis]MBE9031610.1 hypothetical protein [Romeriopsis navalis LEGE 11480]
MDYKLQKLIRLHDETEFAINHTCTTLMLIAKSCKYLQHHYSKGFTSKPLQTPIVDSTANRIHETYAQCDQLIQNGVSLMSEILTYAKISGQADAEDFQLWLASSKW